MIIVPRNEAHLDRGYVDAVRRIVGIISQPAAQEAARLEYEDSGARVTSAEMAGDCRSRDPATDDRD
jgi:hypothetical protein